MVRQGAVEVPALGAEPAAYRPASILTRQMGDLVDLHRFTAQLGMVGADLGVAEARGRAVAEGSDGLLCVVAQQAVLRPARQLGEQ